MFLMEAWEKWFESVADRQVDQDNPYIASIRVYQIGSM